MGLVDSCSQSTSNPQLIGDDAFLAKGAAVKARGAVGVIFMYV